MMRTTTRQYYIPALAAIHQKLKPLALPLLRVGLGAIFVAHGYGKFKGALFGDGLEGMAGRLGEKGFEPEIIWAWGAMIIEFFGGMAIVLGLYTRLFAFFAALMMYLIVFKYKGAEIFFAHRGGIEYELVLAVLFSFFAVIGSGKYGLDNNLRKTF